MNTRHRPLIAAALALGAVAAWATGPAQGQTPAGSQGHALDANPQQGSGGLNRPEGVIDFRARNNIVTGNVTDFRAFRGDVPFSSSGDFRGNLGSDDLFRFRADTFSSGRTQLNAVNVNRNASNLSLSVYATVSQIPGYDFRQSPMEGRQFAPEGGGFQVFNPVFRPTSATGVINEPIAADARETGNTLGVISVPDGRTLEVTASPLLGLRRSELTTAPTTEEEARSRALEAIELEAELRDELDFGTRSRFDFQVEPAGLTEEEITALGPLAEPGGRIEPTPLLGRVINARLTPDRADVPATRTLEDRVEQIESAIFRPLGSRNVEPGADAYLDLLRQLRESARAGEPDEARPGTELVPDDPEQEQDPTDPTSGLFDPSRLEPLEGEFEDALEEPSEQELREARQRAIDARLRALGIGDEDEAEQDDNADDDARDRGPGGPDVLVDNPVSAILERMRVRREREEAEADPSRASLERLLETLSGETAPVATLAGESDTRLNNLMRRAEVELAAGRFFAAEGIYRQIVQESQGNRPLARIGQIHAQLAAGMIRSAGINLRQVLAAHPELIGVRYEANLLPPRERLSFLQQELRRAIARAGGDADAGLLLGYLGFQAGSERLVRYGLSVAQAAAPRDPLLPVVRGVWLERIDAEPQTPDVQGDAARDANDRAGEQAQPSAADPATVDPSGK